MFRDLESAVGLPPRERANHQPREAVGGDEFR